VSKRLKYFAAGALCLLLYICIQFYAGHSEEFRYVEQSIRHSHEIEERVGLVQEVNLPLFNSFKETHHNGDTFFSMSVQVVGSKKTASLNVDAVLKGGAWKIERASADGAQIALE
jgi:hypothetical protein